MQYLCKATLLTPSSIGLQIHANISASKCENLGALTGIEPASPAFWAGVLTTTPQHPGTNYAKFACSNHPWRKAGSAMAVYIALPAWFAVLWYIGI